MIDKVNFIFELLQDYIVETDIIENDIIQLEIYKDDITQFAVIPFSILKQIEQYYEIISISPQIHNIDSEIFGSLVIQIKEI